MCSSLNLLDVSLMPGDIDPSVVSIPLKKDPSAFYFQTSGIYSILFLGNYIYMLFIYYIIDILHIYTFIHTCLPYDIIRWCSVYI